MVFMHITNRVRIFLKKHGLYDLLFYFDSCISVNLYSQYDNKKKIFFLMTPEYGNLGDQAIAYATECFIKDNFPDYELISVTEENTYKHIKAIKHVYKKQDIVFLQGGGNMGNLYPYIERLRRFCIKRLPDARIISMPTTITFSQGLRGKLDFFHSKRIYNKHKHLTLLAREKYTYDFMKKNYSSATIQIVPDIVFYLYKKIPNTNTRRIYGLLGLRNDLESSFTSNDRSQMIIQLMDKLDDLQLFDTTVSRLIPSELQKVEIMSMLHQIQNAAFLITDRMHGMIFSAITKTPCAVLKSLDNKVIGSYQWIQNVNYISLIENPSLETIMDTVKDLLQIGKKEDLDFIDNQFHSLVSFLRKDIDIRNNNEK